MNRNIREKDQHLLIKYDENTILEAQWLVYTSAQDCRVSLNHEKSPVVLQCALDMIEGREGQATKRAHIERALKNATRVKK